MNIAAPHVGNLFDYANTIGIDVEVLRSCLVDPRLDVCLLDNLVSDIEFINVFEAIINADKNKLTGLNYGCYLNLKALGFISQIALNATNIDQAVFILQQYFINSFPLVSLSIKRGKRDFALILECSIKESKIKNHLLDSVFCFIYRELKLMVNADALPKLIMPIKKVIEYEQMLDAKINKGVKHEFVFDSKVLNSEINTQQSRYIEILLPKFLKMLDVKGGSDKPFSNKVRHVILNMCAPELPSFHQVVVQFPLSDRSFQRKLSDEGITFRQLSDEIKKDLATYLLKGNKIRTQDIAHILGYSESSAFLHAAKKWQLH